MAIDMLTSRRRGDKTTGPKIVAGALMLSLFGIIERRAVDRI